MEITLEARPLVMIRRVDRRLTSILLVAVIIVGLAIGPATISAQEEGPSLTLTDANININAGETSTVTAEYQFTVESAGTGDNEINSIRGSVWQVGSGDVDEFTATVNGENVDHAVSEQSAHVDVAVPVEDTSSGETLTVTLEYQVSNQAGELNVPLWVPEYSTPGQANVVSTTVTLPEGTTLDGDEFPSPENVNENVIEYELLHVPGFITMSYGEAGIGSLTSDTLYSILGVVLIIGFIVGGLLIDRKTA